MKIAIPFLFLISVFLISSHISKGQASLFPGADEKTPSKSEYFSWINNTNEGVTEAQTLTNLDFFQWLNNEYGMQLDIYSMEAGVIDGKNYIGSIDSDRFKKMFPNGFDSVYKKASQMDTRLGMWGGPDGFGDTPETEKARIEMWIKLCRDYKFELFKFDAVTGNLRTEKQDAFVKMMNQCRKHSPGLILLNHRLNLGKGMPYATTALWESKETYIDVHMTNEITAPHHRGAALSRGLPPGLKRLTEDHGVCISSCLDYWDDDLVLQAFSRSLILAPQIYGNPWFLRDDEYPKLARIFNLHRKYRDILVSGKILPEEKCGPYAVSRGNGKARIITLRNLTWEVKEYIVKLSGEIGLESGKNIEVRQFHPTEKILGKFAYNSEVKVQVQPFRSCLLVVSEQIDEPAVVGTDFQVIRNIEGRPIEIELLGLPGTSATIKLENPQDYQSAILNGETNKALLKGNGADIAFPGNQLNNLLIRRLNPDFLPIDMVSNNWKELYEATVYSTDNNALEVRSIQRSGWSNIPAVRKAQEGFFNQETFVDRGVWDKNLFDGNMNTGYWQKTWDNKPLSILNGCFRLDLGEVTAIDQLIIRVGDIFSLEPLLVGEGNFVEVSKDLKKWESINFLAEKDIFIQINDSVRYIRFSGFPKRILEIEGYHKGNALNTEGWRASNLFPHPSKLECAKMLKASVIIEEVAPNSYLCVALNGIHGHEGAYVAAKVDGHLMGAPDRSPSYQSNMWEAPTGRSEKNYTYYIPLDHSVRGKPIEVFVMGFDQKNQNFVPEVFINTYPLPWKKVKLVLQKGKV